MKLHKKICSIICTLTIILSPLTSIQVSANSNIDNLSFSESVTDEEKKALDPILIRILSEEEGEIVSISQVNIPFEENKDNISTYVMPTYNFQMTVVAKRIYEKSGKDNFKFIAKGHWIDNPFWELTDCIALAWSDNFTLYDDTCYTLNDNNSPKLTWCTTRNSVTPEQGVAYDVDLLVGERQEYVVLEAKVYKDDDTGSANVVGTYGHVIVTAQDISVGYSGGKDPIISMSAAIGVNLEMASPDYTSFDY